MKKEIIRLFNTLKNNADGNIAKELNLSTQAVCKVLNEYLKEKAERIGEKFYIFESKMNNQEQCTIED
jgi:hypothetical protein